LLPIPCRSRLAMIDAPRTETLAMRYGRDAILGHSSLLESSRVDTKKRYVRPEVSGCPCGENRIFRGAFMYQCGFLNALNDLLPQSSHRTDA